MSSQSSILGGSDEQQQEDKKDLASPGFKQEVRSNQLHFGFSRLQKSETSPKEKKKNLKIKITPTHNHLFLPSKAKNYYIHMKEHVRTPSCDDSMTPDAMQRKKIRMFSPQPCEKIKNNLLSINNQDYQEYDEATVEQIDLRKIKNIQVTTMSDAEEATDIYGHICDSNEFKNQ